MDNAELLQDVIRRLTESPRRELESALRDLRKIHRSLGGAPARGRPVKAPKKANGTRRPGRQRAVEAQPEAAGQ